MAQLAPVRDARATISSSSQTTSKNHFTPPTSLQRALGKAFAIAPTEPYVLSVLHDKSYHLRREAQDCWRISGLFKEQEERLQYQTFVQKDLIESIFQQVSMQDYKHGDRPVVPSTVRLPLTAGAAKKKISLSDYKKKSKTATDSTAKPAEENPSSQTTVSQQEREIEVSETTANTLRAEQATSGSKSSQLITPEKTTSVDKEDAQTLESLRKAIDVRKAERLGRPTLADVAAMSRKRPLHQGPDATERQPTPKRTRLDGVGSTPGSTADSTSSHAVRRPQGVTKELKLDSRPPPKSNTASTSTSTTTQKRRDQSPAPASEQPKPKKPASNPKPPARVNQSESKRTVLPTPPQTDSREPAPRSHRDDPPWQNPPAGGYPDWTTPPRRSATPEDLLIQFRQDREFRERRARLRAERGLTTPPASSPDTTRRELTSEEKYYQWKREYKEEREEKRREREKARQSDMKGIARKHPVTAVQTNDATVTQIPRNEKPATPAVKVEVDLAANQQTEDAATVDHENEQDEQMIVKLKFGKTMRKTVQQYLRLKPTPRPVPKSSYIANLMAQTKPATPAVQKSEVTKVERLQHANGTSKPQPPPLQKSSSTSGAPLLKPASHATPRATTPVSQTVATKSLKPSPLPVKKKDVMDSPQKKSTSSTTAAVRTPARSITGRDITTPSTNGEITLSTPSSSTSNTSQDRPADAAQWNAEFLRLRDIGRTLKNKSKPDDIPSSTTSDPASTTTSLNVATTPLPALQRLEALLAFMLSLLARDMTVSPARRSARPAFGVWANICPFAREIAPTCAPWPHLAGLAHLLTSVCEGAVVVAGGRGAVHKAVEASDKSAAEIESQRQKDIEVMMRAAAQMQGHAEEAERLIPRAVLEREYAAAARELREGALMSGVGIRPGAAVRMGIMFLKTWVKGMGREGKEVGWSPVISIADCGGL